MKRIFIALKIDPADELMKMFSAFKTALKDDKIKWTGTSNLHVTLAFLGDTDERKVKDLDRMLKDTCEGSGEFELRLRGAGIFRSLKDPRVVWTGISYSENLKRLHEMVRDGLNNTGISIENRKFSPHLTLGRIRSIKDSSVLSSLIELYQDKELQNQVVKEVILYESILYPAGPVYEPLVKYPLGKPAYQVKI